MRRVTNANRLTNYALSAAAFAIFGVVFVVPFAFIFVTAAKNRQEAALREFSWPMEVRLVENFLEVLEARNYLLITAFINSAILVVASVSILVISAAMVAFVLQRRRGRWNGLVMFVVLSGLIIPPAVVPTIWMLQGLGLFRTLAGLVLIEVAYGVSFCVLLFRAFLSRIPRELDEAAIIDGASSLRLFIQIVFPLMRPIVVTVVIVMSVVVFNDFASPLYFLPGDRNATVQVTLFNFQSQFNTQYNLLFMNILLITVPPLVMFILFNRKIMDGMTAGAVKG
jgi:raffinose/stachyose/melibiose transport system permease protein